MTDLTLTDAITLIKRMETDHLAALAEKDENTVSCVDYKQLTCSLCTRQKKEIAALEAVVKERNLEWESILGQNMRHATVNDELKERITALTADAPTINKKLLKEFMMMIIHCDEEVNKDGLCNCAWQIGQVLQKLERKNKRLEAIVEILELEKGILQEQKEIMKEQIAALTAERDRLREACGYRWRKLLTETEPKEEEGK